MFEVYEVVLYKVFEDESEIAAASVDVLLSYAAWMSMCGQKIEDAFLLRSAFITGVYGNDISKDPLEFALKAEDLKTREDLIRFLMIPESFWNSLCELKLPAAVDNATVKKVENAIHNPVVISRLIGLQLDEAPLFVHVSRAQPQSIKMHYFPKLGVFLSVGIEVNLQHYAEFNKEDFINVLAALSDSSRFEVVSSLANGGLTTSQIAKQIDKTASTTNHHLKVLLDCGLVSLAPNAKAGKGAVYVTSKSVIQAFFSALEAYLLKNKS